MPNIWEASQSPGKWTVCSGPSPKKWTAGTDNASDASGATSIKARELSPDSWKVRWQKDLFGELLQELAEMGQALEGQLQEHFQRHELLVNQQTIRMEAALQAAAERDPLLGGIDTSNLEFLPLIHEQTLRMEAALKEHGNRAPTTRTDSLNSLDQGQHQDAPRILDQDTFSFSAEAPTPPKKETRLQFDLPANLNAVDDTSAKSENEQQENPRKEEEPKSETPSHGRRSSKNRFMDSIRSESRGQVIPEAGSPSERSKKSSILGDDSSWWWTFTPTRDVSGKDGSASVRHDDIRMWLGDHILASVDRTLEWWFDLEEPDRNGTLARFVNSKWFELITTFVILANTAVTVATTNFEARTLSEDDSAETRIANLAFVIYYSLELILKLIVHRMFFFASDDLMWNCFDVLLVGFAIFELLFSEATLSDSLNVTHMRTMRVSLRVLRTAKTLRMMRVIRSFSQLRLLMNSVLGSLPSLFWSIVMLVFMFFMFSLIFVQGSTLELISQPGKLSPDAFEVLHTNLGSTQMAMLMLFKSTTGGDDWSNYFWAFTETGWWNCALFLFFIAFAQIALLNILTGIFVENAMKLAEPDRDAEALQRRKAELKDAEDLRALCHLVDPEKTGKISEERFMEKLKSSQFRARLALLGLDIKDAALFFQVVSAGFDKEEVDIESFVSGAMRLKGAASSLDLQALMFRTRLIYTYQLQIMDSLQKKLPS